MHSVIREITSQIWAIDSNYVEAVTPFVVSLLRGETVMMEPDRRPQVSFAHIGMGPDAAAGASAAGASAKVPPGSIAIVRMSGVMMKNDQFCGPRGTASIAESLREMDANPNVAGIILQIDSPGGTVDGTEDLARTFAGIKKPKMSYVDGMACSAAMWVASAADEIMLNGQTAMVGSIGTMSSIMDMNPVLEKAGVRFHKMRASASVDKNADIEEALQGNYERYTKNVLDPLNETFTGAIKKYRGSKMNLEKENVLTGKTYIGKAAIKAGLADSIGSLNDAIASLNSRIQNKKPNRMSTLATLYPNLAAVAQWPEAAEALDNGSVEATAEELARVEAALAAAATAAEQLATAQSTIAQHEATIQQQQAAAAELATAQATIAQHQATIDSLQAQVTALGSKTDTPADTSTGADTDPGKPKRRAKFAHELRAEQLLGPQ